MLILKFSVLTSLGVGTALFFLISASQEAMES